MSDLKVVITGAGGRMGVSLIRGVVETDGLMLHGALERTGSDFVGQDAGNVAGLAPLHISITDNIADALEGAEAIIDFTVPAASVALAQEAGKRGMIHIIGTTGCTKEDDKAFADAAKAGATIIKSGNMSLGFNLLASLVKQATAALGDDFDIEIVEMHHNQKVDAPSGAALILGEAAAAGRDIDLHSNSTLSREGITGVREKGTIGFATLRGGNVVGEHSVILAGPSERIELTHKSQDRKLFADGAMRALLWARDKKPGVYSMGDVLGLKL